MVLKWRRAFCTSVTKDEKRDSPVMEKSEPSPRLRIGSRFGGFFSNPSTPRMQAKPVLSQGIRCRTADTVPAVNVSVPSNSAPQSPKLRCKTRESPKFFNRSNPSSPRSPSAFSLIKSSINRTAKSRCGICLQKLKPGQGTAIFTAECGHGFHFPCIAAAPGKKERVLMCPVCNSTWKEMHLFNADGHNRCEAVTRDSDSKSEARLVLKVYNDDEPLSSPTFGARFVPILESDEMEEEHEEFPGFSVAGNVIPVEVKRRSLEISLLSEAAAISVGKSSETYAVVLKIKAPVSPARRAPIDMVAVLNVGRSITSEKLHLMKKMMRLILSSLSDADRLSIVAFSAASKRLLPLRRMTTAGKRSARRIIDAVVALDAAAATATDSLKKAAKVISDRREKNPTACIILLSDGHRNAAAVTSTTFSDSDFPLHSINLSACLNPPTEDTLTKCISGLFSVVIQDLNIQLGFTAVSAPGEIVAVYSYKNKPAFLGSGSSCYRIGDFHSGEEREFLVELKSPLRGAQRRQLSIQCSYRDPSTQQSVRDEHPPLLIPHPRSSGSSTRLRCLYITTRAVTESRRLVQRNDVVGAQRMLASARALVLQTGSSSGEEFVRRLEADLAELSRKGKDLRLQPVRRNSQDRGEAEPLTPTSAWRAAERLAKVAIMRKSLNRVSDLHGFEDARF